MPSQEQVSQALTSLRRHLRSGSVFDRSSSADVDLKPWSATRIAHPLVRVECVDVAEIQTVLSISEQHEIPLAIAGGRCDPWARNNRDGYLIVDLRRMAEVKFNECSSSVVIGGGTTIGHLLESLPDGWVAVTGVNGDVGMVGLSVGGGYGLLNQTYGLASDNIVGADLVLSNGQAVHVDGQTNANLYWAIRGGGSGFGIVTALEVRAFELPRVLYALIQVPLDVAPVALIEVQSLIDAHPEVINILPLFTLGSARAATLILAFLWNGKQREGEEIVSRLVGIYSGQTVQQGWVPLTQCLDAGDLWPWGRSWCVLGCNVPRITEALASDLVEIARAIPAPHCHMFLQSFHGAATEVSPEATAFHLRTEHYAACIAASWQGENETEIIRCRTWAEDAFEKLNSHAMPGGYINFLGPQDGERARQFFGSNAERLIAIKNRVDPRRVFQAVTGLI